MTRLPALFIAVSLGIMIALQPGLNAEVARRLGTPVGAAFLSISTSFTLCAIYILATRQGFPIAALPSLPWYLWIGGIIGFVFVVGGISVAPVLGGALLFAAIVLGQMIGALAGAYLADLLGRKPIILTCTMLSAFLTFSTGFAQTPETLMILRLLAGLTIGGLLAPAWSLNIEVMPRSMRATSVTIIMLGFSLGASASGALTNLIAPHLGWHAVFFLCGALTLILALVLMSALYCYGYALGGRVMALVLRNRTNLRIFDLISGLVLAGLAAAMAARLVTQ